MVTSWKTLNSLHSDPFVKVVVPFKVSFVLNLNFAIAPIKWTISILFKIYSDKSQFLLFVVTSDYFSLSVCSHTGHYPRTRWKKSWPTFIESTKKVTARKQSRTTLNKLAFIGITASFLLTRQLKPIEAITGYKQLLGEYSGINIGDSFCGGDFDGYSIYDLQEIVCIFNQN